MKCIVYPLTLLLACFLGQGCIAIPASGHKISAGTSIESKDAEFIRIGETSRSDIIQSLGRPGEIYLNSSVIVYSWKRVVGYVTGLPPFSIFTPWREGGFERLEREEVFLVQFDNRDRVRRFEFRDGPLWGSKEDFVMNWASQDQP